MTTTDKTRRQKERIQKLLTLAARASNENERTSSMTKALKLMQKYGLSEHEVNTKEIREFTYQTDEVRISKNSRKLANGLARIIGVYLLFTDGKRGKYGHKDKHGYYSVFGTESDYQIWEYFFEVTTRKVEMMASMWRTSEEINITTKTKVERDRIEAYKYGVIDKYLLNFGEAQKEAWEQMETEGTDLVPVDTRLVDAEKVARSKYSIRRVSNGGYGGSDAGDGYRDGSGLSVGRGVAGRGAQGRLH